MKSLTIRTRVTLVVALTVAVALALLALLSLNTVEETVVDYGTSVTDQALIESEDAVSRQISDIRTVFGQSRSGSSEQRNRLEATISDLEGKIKELEAQADNASGDRRIEIEDQIVGLQDQIQARRDEISRLGEEENDAAIRLEDAKNLGEGIEMFFFDQSGESLGI